MLLASDATTGRGVGGVSGCAIERILAALPRSPIVGSEPDIIQNRGCNNYNGGNHGEDEEGDGDDDGGPGNEAESTLATFSGHTNALTGAGLKP